MMSLQKRCIILGFTVLAANAHAWTTSLNLIPIAEILKHREAALDYSISGQQRSYSHVIALQIGLGDRVEVGVDHDLLGTATFNIKGQLYNRKGTAVSAG